MRTEFDLPDIVSDIQHGAISPDAARQRILRFAPAYAFPDPALGADVDTDELDALLVRRVRLAEATTELLLGLAEDSHAGRVDDVGTCLITAASLLGEKQERGVCIHVGELLLRLKAAGRARRHFERARELAPSGKELETVLDRLRFIYNDVNAFPQLLEAATAMEANARANRQAGQTAIALFARARAEAELGKLDAAVRTARDALAARQALPDEEAVRAQALDVSRYHFRIGTIARDSGEFDTALDAFEHARLAAESEGDAAFARLALSESGLTWQSAGEINRGQEILDAAAILADQAGDVELAARWRRGFLPEAAAADSPGAKLTQAMAHLQVGNDPAAARKLLLECIAGALRSRDVDLEMFARGALGKAYADEERPYEAEVALRVAILKAREAANVGFELATRTNLGNLLGRRARMEEAVVELDRAIELGEQLRASAHTDELRQGIGAALARVYEQLAFFSSVSYQPAPGAPEQPPDAARRILVGQKTRAVNLARWCAVSDAVQAAADSGLTRDMLDLRAAEVAIEMASEDTDVPIGRLRQQRATAAQRFRRACDLRQLPLPTEPPVHSVAELQALLREGECLLDLLSLEEGISVALITRHGDVRVGMVGPGRPDRTRLIREWQRDLLSHAEAELGNQARAWRTLDTWWRTVGWVSGAEALGASSRALDEQVFEPLALLLEPLRPAHVYVAAHRELFQLPFWRLEPRLEGIRFSLVPGVNVAVRLRQRARTGEPPWICSDDATGTLRATGIEINGLTRFEQRPPEARELLRSWEHAGRIHVAGHGFFDRQNPYRSGVAVRRASGVDADPLSVPDPWKLGCEMLTVAQAIGRANLAACHLAVLSGCYTGLPRLHPASEFTSLPAALLMAGAKNVVASLWPVHDGAAALFMREFYDALDGGSPCSAALASARTRLAGLHRDEAVRRLGIGPEQFLPPGEYPFSTPVYTDAFQHYGMD